MHSLEPQFRTFITAHIDNKLRTLSMTYGRPSMLSPAAARSMVLPSIIDDEFLTTDPEQPGSQKPGVRCQMAFYVHALRLQEILGQILTALYAGSQDETADPPDLHGELRTGLNSDPYSLTERFVSGDFQTILTLDASLTRWHRELPSELRIDNEAIDTLSPDFEGSNTVPNDRVYSEAWIFVRQRNILYARYSPAASVNIKSCCGSIELTEYRYLHIRILLFRPFLLALLSCGQDTLDKSFNKSLTETVLAKTFLTEISTSCVDAAQSLVKLIADCEDRGSSSLPAWWYNVFCIVSPPLP